MYTGKPRPAERAAAGFVTAAVVVLVAWAFLLSFAATRRAALDDPLQSIVTVPLAPPPPRQVVPERRPSRAPEGEAAPPNIRSTATQIVAPPPPIVIAPPPPVVTATVAGTADDRTAGAAEVPGPGQGAGGVGDGRGSGGFGDGRGGGLGEDTPPRQIAGRLRFSDAARLVGWETLIGRAMTTRFIVGVDGRVSGCRATRSSGLPAVDAEVCRLIEQRFRYRPSRDAAGRAVRAGVEMDHSWDEQF